jgi:hypothetical protein
LTSAHGVSKWRLVRTPLVISLTAIPLTIRASATSERWQRQGTASAHINTTCEAFARSIHLSRLLLNAAVCM